MGITEELKSLEEMKVKGTLTEAEFAAAKTATISKHQSTPIATSKPAQKKKSNIGLWLPVALSTSWSDGSIFPLDVFVHQERPKGKPSDSHKESDQ
jgi:hypothetical protein